MFLHKTEVFISGKLKVIKVIPVWKLNIRFENKTKQESMLILRLLSIGVQYTLISEIWLNS
jgi:hypothetical protein